MDTAPIALPTSTVRRLPHPALVVATVGYTALIGVITLSNVESGSALRASSTWILRMLAQLPLGLSAEKWEFALNIAMFVPLGVLLVLIFGARFFWVALVIALALTFSIEGLQQFIPSRVPDPRDLLANGLGGMLGTLFGVALLADLRGSGG